jgi:4-hydroxybenzoate polyprenyltransferase
LKTNGIKRYIGGLIGLVDILGWQKWFGAAVLGFAFALDLNNSFSPLQFQGLVVGIPLILCYIQSVNDCFDVEIDETKKKVMGKELIVSNIISRKTALTITFSILLVGLVSALFASVSLFVVAVVMALFGTLYSVPPFRLKMKYPFSTLIQFAGCFLPFLAGVASISIVTLQTVVMSSIFAVLAMIHRFAHEIKHYKVDLLTGKGTVAVTKGLKTATTLFRLSVLVGVVEFAFFFALGWFNTFSLFLFVLYLAITIAPWFWLRHMPAPVKTIFNPIIMFSSFVLLLTVLLLYGKIYV